MNEHWTPQVRRTVGDTRSSDEKSAAAQMIVDAHQRAKTTVTRASNQAWLDNLRKK